MIKTAQRKRDAIVWNLGADIRRRKNDFEWFAILLMLAAISPSCSANSILVLIRDSNVWMAADSKLTHASGKPRYGCTIGQGKGFYWAAGSPAVDAPAFRLDAIIAKTAAADGTLLQQMKALLEKSRKPITGQLEQLRATNRARFESLMGVANHDLVKVIFVGMENHVPTVVWATVVAVEQNGRVVVSVDSVQSVIPAEVQNGVVGAGHTKEALRYLAEHHWETVTDPAPLLHQSLLAEAKANPDAVGGPTTILTFGEAGAHWIDGGACRIQHPGGPETSTTRR